MRYTRVKKYKRFRQEKIKSFVIYVVIFPVLSIALGYFITALFILPMIAK